MSNIAGEIDRLSVVEPSLSRLESWWSLFGRQRDVDILRGVIRSAQDLILRLEEQRTSLTNQHAELLASRDDLSRHNDHLRRQAEGQQQNYIRLDKDVQSLRELYQLTVLEVKRLKEVHADDVKKHEELKILHDQFKATYNDLEKAHNNLKLAYGDLQNAHSGLKQDFDDLKLAHSDLKRTHDQLIDLSDKQRRIHDVLNETHCFISSILDVTANDHEKYQRFKKILHDDFIKFANDEHLYQPEARAVLSMQEIESELRLLSQFPEFRKKSVVAVAGGFSSGKSSMITSLFASDHSVSLPIGIKPVTALPTYVYHTEQTRVVGFPKQGGTIDIDYHMYARINHDFIQSLNFDFKRILPFLAFGTEWKVPYENICLIDTPGYNPSGSYGETGQDSETASKVISQAGAVLWVIGLDSNGDIGVSDIEYLREHAEGLPIGIVLNKADVKHPRQVREILKKVSATLLNEGIAVEGVCAYGKNGISIKGEGKELHEMLSDWNKPNDRELQLSNSASGILNDYIKTFKRQIRVQERVRAELKSLDLDLHQLGLYDTDNEELQQSLSRRFKRLRKSTDTSRIKTAMKEAKRIRNLMTEVLNSPWAPVLDSSVQ
jgi:GTPase SAR1 family protein